MYNYEKNIVPKIKCLCTFGKYKCVLKIIVQTEQNIASKYISWYFILLIYVLSFSYIFYVKKYTLKCNTTVLLMNLAMHAENASALSRFLEYPPSGSTRRVANNDFAVAREPFR